MADILKVKSGKMEQYRTKGCRVVEVIHHGSLDLFKNKRTTLTEVPKI